MTSDDREVPGAELFEPLADRAVRLAMERGEFSSLPGEGRPLPESWYADRDPDWWLRRKLATEDVRAILPPALLVRRERENILDTLADVASEDQARAVIEGVNERIVASNVRRDPGPVVLTKKLDVEQTLQAWRARRG